MHILEKFSKGYKPGQSFRTYRWRSSTPTRYNPGFVRWSIRSRQKQFTLIHMLKLIVLWGNPTLKEVQLAYDAPGVLNDELFIAALRAKMKITPSVLSARLTKITQLLGRKSFSMNMFKTWKFVSYQVEEQDIPTRKTKGYSGYVRSPSAVGTKRIGPRILPEPEIFEWSEVVEYNYYEALTVGDFNLGESLVIHLPDDEPNRFETVKPKRK
jgi:hypothetical protein